MFNPRLNFRAVFQILHITTYFCVIGGAFGQSRFAASQLGQKKIENVPLSSEGRKNEKLTMAGINVKGASGGG
jgi:hypothetical protein